MYHYKRPGFETNTEIVISIDGREFVPEHGEHIPPALFIHQIVLHIENFYNIIQLIWLNK